MISCFETNLKSCLDEADNSTLIARVDIQKMFRLGAQRLADTKAKLTRAIAPKVQKIIDTISTFGICMKECVLEKNTDGYCFDRLSCQPKIVEKRTTDSMRLCTKLVDWKEETMSICECTVGAGLE